MVVVILPIVFDWLHPESEIMISKEIIPIKNETIPTTFGNIKSLFKTSNGYPWVVFIMILVIENNDIKKKLAADVANNNILFINFLLDSEISKLATIAIEKPANNELIIII